MDNKIYSFRQAYLPPHNKKRRADSRARPDGGAGSTARKQP
jgi:hypothetical protein